MRWILAVVAVGLAALAGLTFAKADSGLQIHDTTIRGVPLREIRQSESAGLAPGVVVAHGFAGSARLMAGFGDTLARRGFVVVLLDFSGHGASRHGPPTAETLVSDLDTAVGYLRSLPNVDPQRLSLVGHSMGAYAVTRYAAGHPEIAATVAISLSDATEVTAERPVRLLLLVGSAEFPVFHQAAAKAMANSAAGDRRLVEVPAVEHISILYAPLTHTEILAWLNAADGPAPQPANRAIAAVLLLAAFGLGFYPLAVALLGRPKESNPRAASELRFVWPIAVCPLAALIAAVVPLGWMHIAVTSYVVAFTALAGLLMAAAARWQKTAEAPVERRSPLRLSLAAIVLCGYSVTAIAIPLHLGVTHAVPGDRRGWLLAMSLAGFVIFSYGSVRLSGGGLWSTAATFAMAVVVLTGASFIGVAPGFLVLIAPLLAILLAWQAGWTAVLSRLAAPPWLIALVGAILPAWPLAVALPLLS